MSALRTTLLIIPATLLITGCGHPQRTQYVAAHSEKTYATHADQPEYSDVHTRTIQTTPAPQPQKIRIAHNDARYDVTLEQIRQYQRDGSAVIVDARSPDAFQQGHLRGAINLPASHKEENIARMQQDVAPEQLVIIYCSSAACDAGDRVYDYLSSQGYTNLRVYKEGWDRLAMSNVDRESGGDHG